MEKPNYKENQEVAPDDSATDKSAADYSALTHDELVARISELEKQNTE